MFLGLPREQFQFMLRTAILDRLCAPLCEAVTGTNAGQASLSSIEGLQLLLAPIDQESRWHRYHPLLSEYLLERLQSDHVSL
jgi:LuxR family transcriptional regulator, maltose regulon positive regulatory protein